MVTLMLAAVLAGVDGGVAHSTMDPIYSTCPDAPPSEDISGAQLRTDAGVRLLDEGSLLLGPQRSKRVACIMATCDAARDGYKKTLDGPSQPVWWTGWFSALSVGVGVGIAAGIGWNAVKGGPK